MNTTKKYIGNLKNVLNTKDFEKKIDRTYKAILQTWKANKNIYICGNGGSAANAIHIANDFLLGVVGKLNKKGIKIEALTANSSVLTCLANDLSYSKIFSEQLKTKGSEKDLLISLSGSGNSKNIVNAIRQAKKMKIKTLSILGFQGGKCKGISDISIHYPVKDMQISEDLQMITLNICMQRLSKIKLKK
jgi:D-sedoheptulose 7-phosphate isomerase